MRKLKFRAWIKPLQKLSAVNELYFDGGAFACGYDFALERDDIEVMQFTGLKDKNGVDIYEGDIVECWWLAELGYCELNCEHKGVIRFVDCRFEVSFSDKAYIRNVCEDGVYSITELELTCASHDEDYCIEYEVIGNIYENPELLESK